MTVPASYLTSTRSLADVLDAMQRAAVPSRVTHEFLKQLGFPSSANRPLVPILKSLRFANEAGIPTERYRRFKNPAESRRVLAEALREAYSDVFAIDQEAHRLTAAELKGIFGRLTGKHEGVTEKMASTFRAFAAQADFEATPPPQREEESSSLDAPLPEAHPLVLGLMRELPPAGSSFPLRKQRDWLEIAQATFRLIYTTEDEEEGSTALVAVSTEAE